MAKQGADKMTVLEIGENKLIINLTHTEVLCCFASYERLHSLSGNVKAAVSTLIEGVAESHRILKGGKITAQIRVLENNGCEITVTRKKPARKSEEKIYIMDFNSNEALTGAIILLYSRSFSKRLRSSLCKIPEGYRLFVSAKNRKLLSGTDEFYSHLAVATDTVNYSGKILIEEKAIEKYGKIFYRDFK